MLFVPQIKPRKSGKLSRLCQEPYWVTLKLNEVNFEIQHIQKPKDKQIVHVDRLKLHYEQIIPGTEDVQQTPARSTPRQSEPIEEDAGTNSCDDWDDPEVDIELVIGTPTARTPGPTEPTIKPVDTGSETPEPIPESQGYTCHSIKRTNRG